MKEIFLEAIGMVAPGLPSWRDAVPVLRGEAAYVATPVASYAPERLPPNERRRATPTVRAAFQSADDAMRSTSIAASELATVFASSDADLAVAHRICAGVAATPPVVSPTDFHNSVHNAAAGYWSIAVRAQGPSTALSAYDYSFASGLAEAHGMVLIDQRDTLLVAFDVPAPEPMLAKRRIGAHVAVALILTRNQTQNSLAALYCERTRSVESVLSDAALEMLRLTNPAARALPLLIAVAHRHPAELVLPWNSNAGLSVRVRPL